MGQRKEVEKAIEKLINTGLTKDQAIHRMQEVYATRLYIAGDNPKIEEAILNGLSVLDDLSRDTEKN